MAAADSVRNVAIVGPNGTGKTTLLESLLFVAGAIGRKGKPAARATRSATPRRGARAPDEHRGQRRHVRSHEASTSRFSIARGRSSSSRSLRSACSACDAAVVVVEPVLERMIAVAPLLQFLDAHAIPHLVLHQQDGPLRGPLPRPAAEPAPSQRPPGGAAPVRHRPRRRAWSAISISSPSRRYAYSGGRPSDVIPLPAEYREREQAARTRDARDAGRLRRRPDGDAARGPGAADRDDHPRDLRKTLGRRPGRAGVHGRGRPGHGRAAAARGAGPEAPTARRPGAALGLDTAGDTLVQVLKNYHLPHAGKLSLARIWRARSRTA